VREDGFSKRAWPARHRAGLRRRAGGTRWLPLLLAIGLTACQGEPVDRYAQARAEFEPGPHDVVVFFVEEGKCEARAFPRRVAGDSPLDVTRATLDSLLAGPHDDEIALGFRSAIPDPDESERHYHRHRVFDLDPGHVGGPVGIRELRELENGLLLLDFTPTMRAYDHGRSDIGVRICGILRQVEETVGQFPWWSGVRIAIEGESKGILQP
jgi:hypothetical protein